MEKYQESWKSLVRRGKKLKKLMLLAALLAIVLVTAVPAIAQIEQDNEQEADSGDVNQSFTATGGGDNSSQCANVQGTANTGNAQNQVNILQYASTVDDFEFEEVGGTITVNPNEHVLQDVFTCDTQVNQAASASG